MRNKCLEFDWLVFIINYSKKTKIKKLNQEYASLNNI